VPQLSARVLVRFARPARRGPGATAPDYRKSGVDLL